MRQVHDMPASTLSIASVHVGALAAAIGIGFFGMHRTIAWLALVVVGVALACLGALLRSPSQRKAYAAYLTQQDSKDLKATLGQDGWDPVSQSLIRAEARQRRLL